MAQNRPPHPDWPDVRVPFDPSRRTSWERAADALAFLIFVVSLATAFLICIITALWELGFRGIG